MYIYTYGNVRRGGMAPSDPWQGLRLVGCALHIPHDLFVERRGKMKAFDLGDIWDVPGPDFASGWFALL